MTIHHDDARLDDLLAHMGEGDTKDLFWMFLQRGMQQLIDAELTSTIGAELHERSEARTNQRNGGRPRSLSTPAGILSCGSRNHGSDRSFRLCLSHVAGLIKRYGWWSFRRRSGQR